MRGVHGAHGVLADVIRTKGVVKVSSRRQRPKPRAMHGLHGRTVLPRDDAGERGPLIWLRQVHCAKGNGRVQMGGPCSVRLLHHQEAANESVYVFQREIESQDQPLSLAPAWIVVELKNYLGKRAP